MEKNNLSFWVVEAGKLKTGYFCCLLRQQCQWEKEDKETKLLKNISLQHCKLPWNPVPALWNNLTMNKFE